MRKRVLRHRVLWGCVAVLLIAASVAALVYFTTRDTRRGTLAEATVVRASLSSSLSSAGEISEVSTAVKVPLAALVAEDAGSLSGIEKNDYTVSLLTLFGEGGDPVVWRVLEVGQGFSRKTVSLSTDAPTRHVVTLAPVRFDWGTVGEYYAIAKQEGTTGAATLEEYFLSLLLRGGGSDVDHTAFPEDFWQTDEAAAVRIESEDVAALLRAELPEGEELAYEISGLVAEVGDLVLLDANLFTVSYAEKFVTMMLSEYDVAAIHERMRRGERVYASVSVNALAGREMIAEIEKIGAGTSSNGVTYFTLMARLVFPEITVGADGKERGSYAYYDPFLTDETVKYLGVDLGANVREEELLNKNSVTVTAQKNVVVDTLVVPTKCIYYDDAKKPYVVVLDADRKEKRVYIKISLSTGTDAAVTAADGYTLNEGDVLRYTAESSLIGSLF